MDEFISKINVNNKDYELQDIEARQQATNFATQDQIDALYANDSKEFIVLTNLRKFAKKLTDFAEESVQDIRVLVDKIIECNTFDEFPAQGEHKKIYIAKDTNKTYRWDGIKYVSISSQLSYATDANIDTLYNGDTNKFIILSNISVLIRKLIAHVNSWGEELSLLLNSKVDKIIGKSLSTNDFDNTYKAQLDNLDTALASKVDSSLMGVANGIATLDTTGKVPSSQLPSYVDDVIECDTFDDFPATGESGKIYIAKDTNKTYRWGGTVYVEITSSLALGETSSSAYRGDRGKVAYDHATNADPSNTNPHGTTRSDLNLENIDSSLAAKLDASLLNEPNGVASLNSLGKVPTSQLPALLQLGTTHQTAYYGDYGNTAYTHSQLTSGNPHNVTKVDVGLSNVTNDAQVKRSEVGDGGGVAPLDASAMVPLMFLPYLDKKSHLGNHSMLYITNNNGATIAFDVTKGFIDARRCLYDRPNDMFLWDVHITMYSPDTIPLSQDTGTKTCYRTLFGYKNFPLEYSGNYVNECAGNDKNISNISFSLLNLVKVNFSTTYMKISYKCNDTQDIAGPTIVDLYCKFKLPSSILEIPCNEEIDVNLFFYEH